MYVLIVFYHEKKTTTACNNINELNSKLLYAWNDNALAVVR